MTTSPPAPNSLDQIAEDFGVRRYDSSIDGVQLLGATILHQYPIRCCHLRLAPGVTALYGLNGSGKTTILRALRDAVQGQAPRARQGICSSGTWLHLQVDPTVQMCVVNGKPASDIDERYTLIGRIVNAISEQQWATERHPYPAGAFVDEIRRASETSAAVALAAAIASSLITDFGADVYLGEEPLMRALSHTSYLSLYASGNPTCPVWTVYASVRPSECEEAAALWQNQSAILQSWFDRALAEHNGAIGHDILKEWFDTLKSLHLLDLHGRGVLPDLMSVRGDQTGPQIDLDDNDPGDSYSLCRYGPPPDWAPVPTYEVCKLRNEPRARWWRSKTLRRWAGSHLRDTPDEPCLPPLNFVEIPDPIDVDALEDETYLAARGEGFSALSLIESSDTEMPQAAPAFVERLTTIGVRANHFLGALLYDYPFIFTRAEDPEDWADNHFIRWRAVRQDGSDSFNLRGLSHAQIRLASLAIRLATLQEPAYHEARQAHGYVDLLSIDEPEAGLHPTAIQHLAKGLKTLAAEADMPVLVATHSPIFLSDPAIRVVQISRQEDGSAITTSFRSISSVLSTKDLGLTPQDRLGWYRCVLLVEGDCDRAIFEGLFRDEIDDGRILLVCLDGSPNLASAADGSILYDFSSAPVVVCLNNVRGPELEKHWMEAKRLWHDGRADEAYKTLATFSAQNGDLSALRRFCQRVLEGGKSDRVSFSGLSEPDIICYLPVAAFDASIDRWATLHKRFNAARRNGFAGGMRDWLSASAGVNVSPELVSKVALTIHGLPTELTQVIEHCREQSKSHDPSLTI